MPKIESSSVRSVKNEIVIGADGITAQYKSDRVTTLQSDHFIPNILGYIQRYTELTRSTIMRILIESGRINDLAVNPQLFMERAVEAIKRVLQDMMIDGIEYRKLGNSTYEMRLFEDDETYKDEDTFEVSQKEKTIYDSFIPLDSAVETQFAKDCESSEQVKFYFKLPRWFQIPTPIGQYNPDWAVVFDNDRRIYFVAETKDTGTLKVNTTMLRPEEQAKIKCGKAHFRQFDDLEYRTVKKVSDLIE